MPKGTPPKDRPEPTHPDDPWAWAYARHPFEQAHCEQPGWCICGWRKEDHD